MCIIFIAKNVHAEHPLIIAANRDEYFARPTQSPHWWPDAPHLFAGKDLQAGGTWLGYNRQHRIAGITNLRRPDLYQADAKSRGELVKRFLDIDTDSTEAAIIEFSTYLMECSTQYNPFNLLFGDANKLMIFSSANHKIQEVQDGVHSLSNGAPDEVWPKMQRGIEKLSYLLEGGSFIDPKSLFSILNDKQAANDELLPTTGVYAEIERSLSSIFIPEFSLNGMPYGTRSSSIIFQGNDVSNDGVFMESYFHSDVAS